MPRPESKKQLAAYLGMVQWVSRFLPALAEHTAAFSDVRKKSAVWKWTEAHARAHERINALLQSPAWLRHVDTTRPFFLSTDASDQAMGAVLMQQFDDKVAPVEYGKMFVFQPKCLPKGGAVVAERRHYLLPQV